MPSFLEDYSDFTGDGSFNEDGLSLSEYLESYDPSIYRNPSLTADVMIFRHSGDIKDVYSDLSLLMVKRRNHPCIGYWALPGGFAEVWEDLEATARRELEEETGLTGIPIEQLYTWGETWRDPRDRIVTTSYIALVDDSVDEPVAGDDAAGVCWFNVKLEHEGTSSDNNRINDIYRLELISTDGNNYMEAHVKVSRNAQGIIKDTQYSVIDNKGVAFDHPRFIVNGILHIKELMG